MNTYHAKCPVFMESGGVYVTSPFGWCVHPINGKGDEHKGVDITRQTGYSNVATVTAFVPGTGVLRFTMEYVKYGWENRETARTGMMRDLF